MFSPFAKIKSFTLTELLVVMAISVIVVGLAFSVLSILKKNLFSLGGNLSTKTEFRLFEQQLNIDLQNYPSLRYDSSNDKLVFSSPLDSIVYEFETTHILRDSDTLFISPQKKEFYFAGKKKTIGYIDACKFVFKKDASIQTIFSYRRNDALTDLNNGG